MEIKLQKLYAAINNTIQCITHHHAMHIFYTDKSYDLKMQAVRSHGNTLPKYNVVEALAIFNCFVGTVVWPKCMTVQTVKKLCEIEAGG